MRYADLVNGVLPNGTAVYATILTYPFTGEGETLAAGAQPNILARVSDFENPVSSSAFTIAESSLADCDKTDILVRFLSAMYAANLYLNNPLAKECSTTAIKTQLGISAATAALEYTAATSNISGEISPGKLLHSDFTVSTAGLNNIIAVREEFGGFTTTANYNAAVAGATVPGAGNLIDYSLRDAAVATLQQWLLLEGC